MLVNVNANALIESKICMDLRYLLYMTNHLMNKNTKKEVNIKWLMWQSEQICYLPKRKLEKNVNIP